MPGDDFAVLEATSALVIGTHDVFTYNDLVINDRDELEYIRVDDLTGFEDADLRVTEEDNTQEDGSWPGPGFYGMRTMIMTGMIVAGTYPKVLSMQREMQDAFLDLVERPLVISAKPGGMFTHPDVEIYCRKADKLLLSKKIEPSWYQDGYFESPFTISLKATDPAYRSVQVHEQVLVPESVSFLGRGYDRSYDLAYDQNMDEFGNLTTSTNSMVVVNAGNWVALPRITFEGLQVDARLVNHVNDHEIRLSSTVVAGEQVVVDVRTGEVVDALATNRSSYWDPVSDWMRIEGTRKTSGGGNEIELFISDLDSSSAVTVSWQDTYM